MGKHSVELLEILYAAYHSEHGLLVSTNKVEQLRQLMYQEMKTDPMLASLSITRSRTNPDSELCIIKKKSNES